MNIWDINIRFSMRYSSICKILEKLRYIHFSVQLFIFLIMCSSTLYAQRLSVGIATQFFNLQALKANNEYVFSDESYRLYRIEDKHQIDATLWSGYAGFFYKIDFKSVTLNAEPLIGFVKNKYSLLYPVSSNKNLVDIPNLKFEHIQLPSHNKSRLNHSFA